MSLFLRPLSRLFLLAALVLTSFSVPSLRAEQWTDANGETFNGDPAGLIGPLALFKPGRNRGKRLPLAMLRPEDALRYDKGLRALPKLGTPWAEGTSVISRELIGNVQRLKDGKLQDTDLRDRAEPQLLLVFYVEAGGDAREIFRAAETHYGPLAERYGDMFEVLFVGVRHSLGEQVNLAESLEMPWLVMKIKRQSQLDEIAAMAPTPAPGFALINRHGVPLTSLSGIITSDVDQVFAQLEGLLAAMVPNNPKTWMQKVAYYSNVRKAEFATGEADPMLVGPPLLDALLAKIGVTAFELDAEIDETGKATNVVVQPGPGIPDKYLKAVAKSFAAAPFVPAVRNGQFVPGKLHYSYRAPTEQ